MWHCHNRNSEFIQLLLWIVSMIKFWGDKKFSGCTAESFLLEKLDINWSPEIYPSMVEWFPIVYESFFRNFWHKWCYKNFVMAFTDKWFDRISDIGIRNLFLEIEKTMFFWKYPLLLWMFLVLSFDIWCLLSSMSWC